MAGTVLRWRDRGACKGQTDVMFPEDGQSAAPAKAICATCPVTAECLAFAMDEREDYGVWGGLSARDRRMLRRGERTSATEDELTDGYRPTCGTLHGRAVHRHHGERTCDRCREAHRIDVAHRRAIARAISRETNKQGSK